ncbi:hypothetical protein [Cellvibrio sp. UBA7661]|uniref:glycosyltransferase n=1 Tax=Cellvibrio sp. UBA7661 TaxID=1946311 RepID=UPI002F35A03A
MKITVFGTCALPHSSQIYTGLHRLQSQKKIDLHYTSSNGASPHTTLPQDTINRLPGVLIKADKNLVFIDLLDSSKIEDEVLHSVQFYLKRSYASSGYASEKIFPLGLNFEIYNNYPYWYESMRYISLNYSSKKSFKSNIGVLLDAIGISFLPRIKNFECMNGHFKEDDSVLFMVRTWDPLEAGTRLTEEEQEDRHKINCERAELIKNLKIELGDKFIGGFTRSIHSAREYPDLVLSDSNLTKKKNYLSLVRKVPICIATTGLHGSIGWKMAEYVALGRAIVSEASEILIPDGFAEGKNYLQFDTNNKCIDSVLKLIGNRELRQKMMMDNLEYYKEHLLPEKLVENAIKRISL